MTGLKSAVPALLEMKSEINEWLELKRSQVPLPFYGSFDIRDAGWKAVVVDSNAFPAGFNNISEDDYELLSHGIHDWFQKCGKLPNRLLIWPESHTRNPNYMANISVIGALLKDIEFEVLIGSDILNSQTIHTSKGDIDLAHVEVGNQSVTADGKPIDMILLNSDLSEGPLEISGVNITPPNHMGWHSRSKCQHFEHVSDLVHELGDLVGIDPWLIGPWGFISRGRCLEDIQCRERLAGEIQEGLDFISSKYEEHGINSKPALFVKNDRGTYGLGILRVESPDEILNLSNRKMNRLAYAKGGVSAEDFLLQEAVPTYLKSYDSVLEPVGYGVNGRVSSWFHRSNPKYGVLDNLNTPSTRFILDSDLSPEAESLVIGRRWLHTLVAEISMIAMGREMQSHDSSDSEL